MYFMHIKSVKVILYPNTEDLGTARVTKTTRRDTNNMATRIQSKVVMRKSKERVGQ